MHPKVREGLGERVRERGREEGDKMQQLKNKASEGTKHTKKGVREMW